MEAGRQGGIFVSLPRALARVQVTYLVAILTHVCGKIRKTEIQTLTVKVGYVLFTSSILFKTMVCQKT